MAFDIGPYRGNGEDLAALITQSWLATYKGRAWFPWWDADYVAWRIMDPRVLDRELIVCAYDDEKLIGCVVGEPGRMRVRDETIAASLASYFSVAPGYDRSLALRLLNRLFKLHRARDLRLIVAVSHSARDAEAARFWAVMARRMAGEFAFTGRYGMWTAIANADAVSRAALGGFERWGSRVAGMLPWGWTGRRGATLRAYRSDDLESCLAWTHAQGATADVQMLWSRERMALQLDHPFARTWIADDGAGGWGFVNGYLIDWQGQERVRVGFLELCAGASGTLRLSSLLVAAARKLVEEGAAMVVMMDAGAQPRAALLSAGFLPVNPKVQTMALLDIAKSLPQSTRLHCPFT